MNSISCPVCGKETYFLVTKQDRFNQEYVYVVCKNCRFLFDKDLILNKKVLEQKISKLYSIDYSKNIDYNWQWRGDGFLKIINRILKIYELFSHNKKITVLDYGGGNGYIASKIFERFNVLYYDKYEKPTYEGNYKILEKPIKADVIYAVELVEHLMDLKEWNLLKELEPKIFVFTTCLHDMIEKNDLPDWEYLNPDAGHIALHSHKSLSILARKYGFFYFFFPNITCHIFVKNKIFSKIDFVKFEYFLYNILRKVKHLLKK